MLYFHLLKYNTMLKQFFTAVCCILFVASCNYFDSFSKRETIQKVDTIVDFNSVDAFPLFPNCSDIPSREKQQICFQMEMSQHIYAALKKFRLHTSEKLNDTILVKLQVSAAGKTTLSGVIIAPNVKQLIPEFDSIVTIGLEKLPTLQPAIKRAMPVTTEFTLPIVLKN